MRRLGSEVRHLKDRLAELLGAVGGGAGREVRLLPCCFEVAFYPGLDPIYRIQIGVCWN